MHLTPGAKEEAIRALEAGAAEREQERRNRAAGGSPSRASPPSPGEPATILSVQ